MSVAARWGVCATVKAPAEDILRFAAHYLEAGAHRVWVYLDGENTAAFEALKAHPKCRAIHCDDNYWKRQHGRRPVKHQVRQSLNATRALRRAEDVDWLLHADVDEFVVSDHPVDAILAALPSETFCARIRPMEALAPSDGTPPVAFKRFIPPGPDRQRIVASLYPAHGAALKGGFLSHVAGKLFTRTGQPDVTLRIHNAFRGDRMIEEETAPDGMRLAHLHTVSWEHWRAHFDYRHNRGAYRADLAPVRQPNGATLSLHQFLGDLQSRQGETGLRAFFDETCADTPALRARLSAHDLLELHDLQLPQKRLRHFPRDPASGPSV